MIKLKTKSGRLSNTQLLHMVTGSLIGMSAGFYQAVGLSPETAIIVMTVIAGVDKFLGMWIRTNTSEGM